jgi:hypothetical protein
MFWAPRITNLDLSQRLAQIPILETHGLDLLVEPNMINRDRIDAAGKGIYWNASTELNVHSLWNSFQNTQVDATRLDDEKTYKNSGSFFKIAAEAYSKEQP